MSITQSPDAPISIPTTVLRVTHHPANHIAERYPYAAFGSNLSFDQMAERCPSGNILCAGKLLEFRFAFCRFATIFPDEKSSVPVGVYTLTANDVDRLDRQEGLGRSYDRYLVTVLTSDGRAIRCFTYIMKSPRNAPPSEKYYQRVLEGYGNWGFDDRRLRHARERAVKESHKQSDSWVAKIGQKAYKQAQLPFADIDKNGRATIPSLVTGRPIPVPQFVTLSTRAVEFGQRDGESFFRAKGTRTWYRELSGDASLVRGELAQNLPGSKAFIPKETP